MDETGEGAGKEAEHVQGAVEAGGGVLARLMDELAHGVIVATPQGRLLHTNNAAREQLRRREPLLLRNGQLDAADPRQTRTLQQALAKAGGGRRSMVGLLASAGWPLNIAVVPLRAGPQARTTSVGLFLSRGSVCDPLMLCFFARAHGLTNCEEQVLAILCQGYSAPEAAQQLHVAVSTVRSHVRSLCAKTHTNSVRALVTRVAVLPPVGAPPHHLVH